MKIKKAPRENLNPLGAFILPEKSTKMTFTLTEDVWDPL
jgi:hypothetical protein